MNHHATELLARERITNWHNEADGDRLVRANPKASPVPQPARRDGRTGPHGPVIGWRRPVGGLTGRLGQVRMIARRLARGT